MFVSYYKGKVPSSKGETVQECLDNLTPVKDKRVFGNESFYPNSEYTVHEVKLTPVDNKNRIRTTVVNANVARVTV